MTTFRHDDASPVDSAWVAGPLDKTGWLDAPTAGDHLLVLAAHPDDETLGAGGLMASAHTRGARITVVVATAGEASHPRSPTHTPDELAGRRRGEVIDAVKQLAPDAPVHLLGLPDGRLRDVTEELQDQVKSFTQGVTHIVAPWEGDRHPDHAACARAGASLARRVGAHCWQYPIWAWHWADPESVDALPWASTHRLALSDEQQLAKRAAIGAHVSQHSPLSDLDGDEAIIGRDMLSHFARPFETFVVVSPDDASTSAYFDRLYADAPDPWGLATRFYETRKRALLLASLPRARFTRAFEPGCATGLLTAELARRCEHVLAWDVADAAIEQAQHGLAGLPNVRVERGAIPDEWPEGEFDLVVLSEVGYYSRDLGRLARQVWASLGADGVLLACHWRHAAPDHPHTADEVHAALDRPERRIARHVEDDFRLDVWSATGRSVAAETGVIA